MWIFLVKSGDKDLQSDLSSQIQVLSDKIDAVDVKLTKVEQRTISWLQACFDLDISSLTRV
jgi:hypothetical protein